MRGYDHWKTTNPADEFLGPEPDEEIRQAQCDCCGKMVGRDQICRLIAYGIETYACDECRGER